MQAVHHRIAWHPRYNLSIRYIIVPSQSAPSSRFCHAAQINGLILGVSALGNALRSTVELVGGSAAIGDGFAWALQIPSFFLFVLYVGTSGRRVWDDFQSLQGARAQSTFPMALAQWASTLANLSIPVGRAAWYTALVLYLALTVQVLWSTGAAGLGQGTLNLAKIGPSLYPPTVGLATFCTNARGVAPLALTRVILLYSVSWAFLLAIALAARALLIGHTRGPSFAIHSAPFSLCLSAWCVMRRDHGPADQILHDPLGHALLGFALGAFLYVGARLGVALDSATPRTSSAFTFPAVITAMGMIGYAHVFVKGDKAKDELFILVCVGIAIAIIAVAGSVIAHVRAAALGTLMVPHAALNPREQKSGGRENDTAMAAIARRVCAANQADDEAKTEMVQVKASVTSSISGGPGLGEVSGSTSLGNSL